MTESSNRALIHGTKKSLTFEDAYRTFQKQALRTISLKINDPSIREDIAHDVWIGIYRRFSAINPNQFEQYLNTCVYNECRKYNRRNRALKRNDCHFLGRDNRYDRCFIEAQSVDPFENLTASERKIVKTMQNVQQTESKNSQVVSEAARILNTSKRTVYYRIKTIKSKIVRNPQLQSTLKFTKSIDRRNIEKQILKLCKKGRIIHHSEIDGISSILENATYLRVKKLPVPGKLRKERSDPIRTMPQGGKIYSVASFEALGLHISEKTFRIGQRKFVASHTNDWFLRRAA